MKSRTLLALAVAVAALSGCRAPTRPPPEEPAGVENTRAPGQIEEGWDCERRQDAGPH
ncbi:hypothetical protein IDM40_12745 [Nocardiopsis sp. HNM0947]|uniref:Lipoprotein n=1 Tax=Nocardiopsis coralli TaxID=2772213 RepID=A0ABR9P6V6_9ACTN|nr:hypothetical protein [Nocardiopsis coralli]MBE2999568.1 hypothetical protein [Nocardiopsis coralli]